MRPAPPVEASAKGFLADAEELIEELGLNEPEESLPGSGSLQGASAGLAGAVPFNGQPNGGGHPDQAKATPKPAGAPAGLGTATGRLWRKRTQLTNAKDPTDFHVFRSATEASVWLKVGQSKISGVRNRGVVLKGFYVTDAVEDGGHLAVPPPAVVPKPKPTPTATPESAESEGPVELRPVAAAANKTKHARARPVRLRSSTEPANVLTFASHTLAAFALRVEDRIVSQHRLNGKPCKGWFVLAGSDDAATPVTTADGVAAKEAGMEATAKRKKPDDSQPKGSGKKRRTQQPLALTEEPETARTQAPTPAPPMVPDEPIPEPEPPEPSAFDQYAELAVKATGNKWPALVGAIEDVSGLSEYDAKWKHAYAGGKHSYAGGRDLSIVLAGQAANLISTQKDEEEEHDHALPPTLPGHSGRLYSGPQNRRGRNRDFLVVKRHDPANPKGSVPLRPLDAGTWYDVTAMEKENYIALDVDSEDGYFYIAKILGLVDASSAGAEGVQYLAYIMWPAFPEFDPVWVPYTKDFLVQFSAIDTESFQLVPPEFGTPKIGYAYTRRPEVPEGGAAV